MARAIDAEGLAKKVNEEICRCDCVISTMFARRFKKLIDEQPTIEAEPVKHGKWELKHIGVGHYWECSVCHTNPCIYVTKDTKFCPNCGARMDGE